MKLREAFKRHRNFDPHETAHAIALEGMPLAEFRQRALAIAIDFLVVLLVAIPIEISWQYMMLKHQHRPSIIRIEFSLHHLQDLAWIVVYAGLSLWRSNGFTLGKRVVGIRVVSINSEKITLWQAVERTLGYGASALEAGFGFVQFFIHQNRQCVHDRIAETIVVKAPRGVVTREARLQQRSSAASEGSRKRLTSLRLN